MLFQFRLFPFRLFPLYSPNNSLKIPSPFQLFLLQIQSMSPFKSSPLILGFFLCLSSIPPSLSQTCNSQKFTSNNLYSHCLDLPTLSSYLHFSFNSTNSTLAVAFRTSSVPSGWVSWALNPKAASMAGAQALVAFKDSKGSLTVKTYNISGYSLDSVAQSKLDFEVWDARAEDQNGVTTVFAKIKIPADLAAKGSVNQVWQVGPSVDDKGVLAPHAMNPPNLNAKAALDLNGGNTVITAGGVDSKTKKRNIHGVLNAVSWGILFPLGIIIARYLRTFQSADPIWFYLHVGCQVSAYAIGVAGWATGIKLGRESKGITWSTHRNIGIALFAMATLQIFALFLRPKKDHKYRFYWNVYHHGVGYAILVLGVLNVFKGLDILNPEKKWKSGYIIGISVLGGVAVLLEVITWIVVLRRSGKSTKPYDGYNGHGREQPLHA